MKMKAISVYLACVLIISPTICTAEITDINNNGGSEKFEEGRKCLSNKELYAQLKVSLASIKESCGQICDQTVKGEPGKYFEVLKKDVNCEALFTNPLIDKNGEFESPPMRIPKWLSSDFAYGGQVPIENFYRDDSNGSTHYTNWTQSILDIIQTQIDNGILTGPYGRSTVENIEKFLDHHVDIKDKHVLIVGSQTPWIELIALNKGAKKVTSVDYVKIVCEHPQIELMTTNDLNQKYLEGTLPNFDVLISFSSLEHSGLGRYGDGLNPWGDVISMAKSWCLLKSGAKALIGVPAGPQDKIVFNSHRIYGDIMFPHLFANWNQVYTDIDYSNYSEKCDYCYQPLVVLEKP